jgi:succinate-acetate transporter protein
VVRGAQGPDALLEANLVGGGPDELRASEACQRPGRIPVRAESTGHAFPRGWNGWTGRTTTLGAWAHRASEEVRRVAETRPEIYDITTINYQFHMADASMATPSGSDWANPAVVGLMGFGTTTMLTGWLNTGNLGVSPNPVLGMAMAFGGSAQFIAGWVALRKSEIFAGSAFVGYGSFWLALSFMLTLLPTVFSVHPTGNDLLAFWIIWGLFTFSFMINSFKHGIGVPIVFVLLFLAFVLLAVDAYLGTRASPGFVQAMGWEIFIDGLAAWATATAILTNGNYGRKVIPI